MTKKKTSTTTSPADHGLAAMQQKLEALASQRDELQATIADLEVQLNPKPLEAGWDGASVDVQVLVEDRVAIETKLRASRDTLATLETLIEQQSQLLTAAGQKAENERAQALMPGLLAIQQHQCKAAQILLESIVGEREYRAAHREVQQANPIAAFIGPTNGRRQFEKILRQWVQTMREAIR